MKLILADLHMGLYQDNIMCAYVFYGTEAQPTDHTGNLLSTFYQGPKDAENQGQRPTIAFEQHLQKKVIPSLNKHLAPHGYLAAEVDVVNQAPHPYLAIKHQDNRVMTKDDLVKLRDLMTKSLTEMNKPKKVTFQKKLPSFFNIPNDTIDKKQPESHGYNLRSRKC